MFYVIHIIVNASPVVKCSQINIINYCLLE